MSPRWTVVFAFLQTTLICDVASVPPAGKVGTNGTRPSTVQLIELVEIPGDPGNSAQVPVIRRIPTNIHVKTAEMSHKGAGGGDHTGPGVYSDNQGPSGAHRVTGGVGKTHIDLPGQHGNESPFPVVHRDTGTSAGETHVDLPGQHGNDSPLPVVHRGHVPDPHAAETRSSGRGKVHVDLPGQHGNNSPHPVVHRIGSPPNTGGGRRRQDTFRGNRPLSVVPDLHAGETGSSDGMKVHVDLPGQHGNNSPHPVVHRSGSPPNADEAGHDPHGGGSSRQDTFHELPNYQRVDRPQGRPRGRQEPFHGNSRRGFETPPTDSVPDFERFPRMERERFRFERRFRPPPFYPDIGPGPMMPYDMFADRRYFGRGFGPFMPFFPRMAPFFSDPMFMSGYGPGPFMGSSMFRRR
ncbi:hypothetical protein MAR_022209 [Mya arenaria]|uniref:Uncharacterized protein n=1 Tax=Mya arenaria TaxID=6604 RepID=A0ABY7DMK5_MYAAR|nr:hornerin-like [Mya arenaria]WAQ97836.1 hypothetical protein MAR_022209 [Mya arenaria]